LHFHRQTGCGLGYPTSTKFATATPRNRLPSNEEVDSYGETQGRGHAGQMFGGKPGLDAGFPERHAAEFGLHRVAEAGDGLEGLEVRLGRRLLPRDKRGIHHALAQQGLDDRKDLGAPILQILGPKDLHQFLGGQAREPAAQVVGHGIITL
jgi:hypothetical protein